MDIFVVVQQQDQTVREVSSDLQVTRRDVEAIILEAQASRSHTQGVRDAAGGSKTSEWKWGRLERRIYCRRGEAAEI